MVADAARAFKPTILYPYHFGSTDTNELVELLKDEEDIEVCIRQMAWDMKFAAPTTVKKNSDTSAELIKTTTTPSGFKWGSSITNSICAESRDILGRSTSSRPFIWRILKPDNS